MKYWFGEKPKREGATQRSFPVSKASLIEEVVADIPELEVGLKAFAKRLSEQLGVNGIEIHEITFTTYDNIK